MSHRMSEVAVEFDELTDLPTMIYFRRYANAFVNSAFRLGRKVYLVYFNLQNFSVFNERYGFEEGDKLLTLTALAIQEAFPGYLLSRFSEDHFFLVCESLTLTESIMDVRERLHSFGRHANVELKAGIFEFTQNAVDIGVACDRAKIACDSIAHRYDRTYRWYDDALKWRVERGQYIESHIDRAVQEGWIKVFFQPIVRTVTGRVCEFEALARWDDPRYGMLSPLVFVEVLEESRLIHKLDAYMVRETCRMWRQFSDEGLPVVPVSINLSRLDFELCDVFEMVEHAAKEFRVPHQMLHVEVTESALNDSSDMLAREVARFRSAGYQVWLDDFGSGYSSLNTLKDYTFDVVKVDMAFLREFDSKPQSRVIIASIINMAKQLGMQTLVEGVETPEQFDFLHDIGCEFVQGFLIGRPMSSDDNIKRIESGELVMGDPSLHGYLDRLGAINTLSATPYDFPWEQRARGNTMAEMLPLGIFERENRAVRFVTTTRALDEALREIGFSNYAELTKLINDEETNMARNVQNTLDAALASRQIESVDVLQNGLHCAMRVRYIASHGDVDAFLVSFFGFTRFSNVDEEKRIQIAMRYLYSVYDEANIVDMADGTVNTIYRANSLYPATATNEPFGHSVKRFARDYVHPDDRERCVRFLDLSTLEQRLESSGRNYLAEALRTLRPNGSYAWLVSVLIPIMLDGEQSVLVCVRDVNREVMESVNREEAISKALLWDTLLDLLPAGVFWKDAERRFLGVNKNFLDFYSFDSVNDVLGKTDEDMGWHVDVDPFMSDELRVIERGEAVVNALGTCISQGEVRNIRASKIPLRRNGEIVGLLGYFTDRIEPTKEGRSLIFDGFDRMAELDQLTGVSNMRGILASTSSYQEVYESGGPDFMYAVIDIQGMRDLNEVYGRSFGNRILKVVARSLTRACGVSAVVARVGGDKFAVLRQVGDIEGAVLESDRLRQAIEDIHDVDGIHVRLRCFIGWVLASEGVDADEMYSVANDRMHRVRNSV